MRCKGSLLIGFMLCLPTACTNLTSPARAHRLWSAEHVYWFDYAADRRGAILAPRGRELTICAEPAPDVALNQTTDLVAKVTVPGKGDVDAQAKLAAEVVQLAGRTQLILFLRESMYRLCEQSMSGNLSPAEVKELYTRVVDATVTLANATAIDVLSQLPDDPRTQKLIDDFFGERPDAE